MRHQRHTHPRTPQTLVSLLVFCVSLLGLLSLSFDVAHAQATPEAAPSDAEENARGSTGDQQVSDQQASDQQAGGDETPAAPVLTKAPAIIEFVDAEYPESAKAEQVEASVILTITLDVTGKVTEAVVAQSSGSSHAFDQAALDAVKRCRFSPAEFNGKPGPVRINFEYKFAYEQEVVEIETKSESGKLSGLILERGTRRPLGAVLVRITNLGLE